VLQRDETVHTQDEFGFAASTERDNAVGAALQRLKPHDKEVIVLRFFHDLSLDTIADRLGTSLSGAKMRLYRAIARFEQVYLDLEADVSDPSAA
jgi:RNA polymerase sigma factor (sigma-70 family)